MFEWIFGKNRYRKLEEETVRSFSAVKKDIEGVGKWIKHLDEKDKQLFDVINELKLDLSSIKDEIEGVKEAVALVDIAVGNKQAPRKIGVCSKQTGVGSVVDGVQTAVQTANIYDILKSLSGNERLVVFALMNSEMRLSYEDLALLLGKERSTIRGQINAIKQKSEGLIEEIIEKNGKKRVFIPLEIKEKLAKYAKVRVKKSEKSGENE